MAEGEFHEAMNLAALWSAPVLFVCENNLYAMGTSLRSSESETNLAVKAAAYNVPAWSIDGMDVVEVAAAAERALTVARAGGGPVFLECRTYRFRAHSMFDPDLYRPKAEIEAWIWYGPRRRMSRARRRTPRPSRIAGQSQSEASCSSRGIQTPQQRCWGWNGK